MRASRSVARLLTQAAQARAADTPPDAGSTAARRLAAAALRSQPAEAGPGSTAVQHAHAYKASQPGGVWQLGGVRQHQLAPGGHAKLGNSAATQSQRRVLRRGSTKAGAPAAAALGAAEVAGPAGASNRQDCNVKYFNSGADKVNIKAQVVFDACWRKLEDRYKNAIQCPAEVVWLNGAPGSGKGVNTPFILKSRGLSRAVAMSSLLHSNAAIKEVMDRGELVPDTMVGDALLEVIFNPDESDGAGLIVDGFPRTALQVDFVKLLFDKMMALHLKHADGPEEWRFPRPSFKVVVLYVEQEESVRRQLMRAQLASLHNKRARDAGSEDMWELRKTDVDDSVCRRRYQIFKEHYSTLLRLKQYFPFSLIDAMGSLDDTRAQIARELRYQSSLDLDAATYAAIRHLPLAKDMVRTSRQQLVHRLDTYCKRNPRTFGEVIQVIDAEAVPLLKRCSLAGHAELKTRNRLFREQPLAADMFIDIMSDRGYSVAHYVDEFVIPTKVDLATGDVSTRVEQVHHFRITFEKQGVREMAALAEQASAAADAAHSAAIGQTFVPSHLDRDRETAALRRRARVREAAANLMAAGLPELASPSAPANGMSSAPSYEPGLEPQRPGLEPSRSVAQAGMMHSAACATPARASSSAAVGGGINGFGGNSIPAAGGSNGSAYGISGLASASSSAAAAAAAARRQAEPHELDLDFDGGAGVAQQAFGYEMLNFDLRPGDRMGTGSSSRGGSCGSSGRSSSAGGDASGSSGNFGGRSGAYWSRGDGQAR